jgi:beta-N-acetylhexosaminidase
MGTKLAAPWHHADVHPLARSTDLAACAVAVLVAGLVAGCSAPAPAPGPTSAISSPPPASSTSTPSASAPVGDPAAVCARALLDPMEATARAAQLLMVGVPAADAASGAQLVRSELLGGVFLAGRSSLGVSRTRAAVDALQRAALGATGMRLLVGTDQEGGQVQTLSGPGFSDIPSALEQGSWSTPRLRAKTQSWAAQLTAAGITLDLAPVADTVAPADRDDNPPIGRYDREYGGDPAVVASRVAVVVSAMRGVRLGSTVKHFPGLGRVDANTDTSTRAVDPVVTADDPNLRPFSAGIAAGATAVMISSARYPRLDPARLAMFSPAIVTGLLRQRMAYTGLVISDDVGRAIAVQSLTPQQRALAFVGAGGDVVLTVVPSDAAPMVAALAARAAQNATFASLVDAAAYRVLLTKVRAGLARCS